MSCRRSTGDGSKLYQDFKSKKLCQNLNFLFTSPSTLFHFQPISYLKRGLSLGLNLSASLPYTKSINKYTKLVYPVFVRHIFC